MPPGRPSTNVACSDANVLVLLHGTPRSGSIYDPTPGAEFGGSDPPSGSRRGVAGAYAYVIKLR